MTVDILSILFGVTLLYLSVTSRAEALVRMTAVQGFLLFLIAVAEWHAQAGFALSAGFLVLSLETLGFKAIAIPWYMSSVLRENEIFREGEPSVPRLASLALATAVLTGALLVACLRPPQGPIPPLPLGVSFAAVASGILLIITRRDITTHIIGYLVLENGIFLLSLSLAHTMPLIVSLGVSLDIFLGVFLAGMFVTRIRGTFDGQSSDQLTSLKD